MISFGVDRLRDAQLHHIASAEPSSAPAPYMIKSKEQVVQIF